MPTGKWTGLEEAVAAAQALGQELATEKVLLPVLREQAEPLLAEVQRGVATLDNPKTPEKLADEFVIAVSRAERAEGRALVQVGPKRRGRGFVVAFFEWGTSKMAARPTVRPAWDSFAPGFPAACAAALRAKTAELVRRLSRRAVKGARA